MMLKVFLAIIGLAITFVLWRWAHWLLGYVSLAVYVLWLVHQAPQKWRRHAYLGYAIAILSLFTSTALHTFLVRSQGVDALIESGRLFDILLGSPAKLVIVSIVLGTGISVVIVALIIQALLYVTGELLLHLSQNTGLSRADIMGYLWSLFLRTGGPSIIVQDGQVVEEADPGWLHRLGGPGLLIVRAGNAVVLNTAKGEERVVGAGTFRLKTFEKMHEVVDLRPQEEEISIGRVLTRDRISLAFDLNVSFQIEHKEGTESRVETYLEEDRSTRLIEGEHPVYKDIVLRAVHNSTNNNWRKQTVNQVGAALRDVVSRYGFQELLYNFASQPAKFDPEQPDRGKLIQGASANDTQEEKETTEDQAPSAELDASFLDAMRRQSMQQAARSSGTRVTPPELIAFNELEEQIRSQLVQNTLAWGVAIQRVDIVNMHIPSKLLDAALNVWEKWLETRSAEQDAVKQDTERISKIKWLRDVLEEFYRYDEEIHIKDIIEFLAPFFAPDQAMPGLNDGRPGNQGARQSPNQDQDTA